MAKTRVDRYLEQLQSGKRDFSSNPEISRLQLQNDKADAYLRSFGAKKKKGGPSILSRAFDILSRGQYLTAGAVQGALKKGGRSGILGSLQDAATGGLKGATGKRKVSYSQILAEHGVKNKWVKGGVGFAGDVLLDPTTYLGPGIIKGVSKGAAKASGAKLAGEAAKELRKSGVVEAVVKKARQEYEQSAFLAGEKITTKAFKKEAKKVGKEAGLAAEQKAMNEATKGALQEVPNKLQIKFAGKPIIESERAAKALGYPGRRLARTETGQALSKLFTNKSGPITEAIRRRHGESISLFDDWAAKPIIKIKGKEHSWRDLPLGKKESRAFLDAYETGHVKEFVRQNGQFSKKGVDWEELAAVVKKENDSLAELDIAEGLMKTDTPLIENYLYHKYNAPTQKQAGFKSNRRRLASDIHKPGQERKIPTLKEAREAGLDPEMDLRVLMMNRGAKTYSSSARKYTISDAVEQFGIEGMDKAAKNAAKRQGHDLVNLRSHLTKDMSKQEKERSLAFLGEDTYVPREIADYLVRAEKTFRTPDEINKFVKLFDNVQQRWKGAVTVYNPGHHVRNLASDVYLGFLDGVTNPLTYAQASKILWKPDSLGGKTKLGKNTFENKQLINWFKESGAAPSWMITHVDEGSRIFRGKISQGVHKVSKEREEFGRFAHWLHAFEEGMKGKSINDLSNIKKASQEAGERVRKWHIDYTDLTPFERNVMKRVIPFYTWTRHSAPLMVEALLTKPGKVAAVPKGMSALQTLLGGDPDDLLPVDLIPKWLREMGGTQVGESNGNPLFMSPAFFPGTETANLLEGGRSGFLNNISGLMANAGAQVSPLIRGPAELSTGRTFFGNMPIDDTWEYLKNQIPAARTFNTVTSNRNDPDKNDMRTRLINYLTGAGLTEVTPNRIKGELQRQLDPKQKYLKKVKGK